MDWYVGGWGGACVHALSMPCLRALSKCVCMFLHVCIGRAGVFAYVRVFLHVRVFCVRADRCGLREHVCVHADVICKYVAKEASAFVQEKFVQIMCTDSRIHSYCSHLCVDIRAHAAVSILEKFAHFIHRFTYASRLCTFYALWNIFVRMQIRTHTSPVNLVESKRQV